LRQLHFVAALLHEADGGVWIAHEDGVTHWLHGTAQHYSAQAGGFPGRGLSLLRDRDGTLWAGSERSLNRLDDATFRPLAIPESFELTEIDVLYQDRAGALWIGDASPRSPGLIRLDAKGFHLMTQREGLPHTSINTIIEQGTNSALWVGTGFAGSGGAVTITNGSRRAIGRQEGLAGDKVRTIFEDSHGRLWFGSEYDGVAIFGESRLAVLGEAEGLAGPEVKAMVEYPTDTFWLGTNGGLTRIERFDLPQGDSRYPGFGSTHP
jgi:ligand-binding sensor domain-containing protein